MLRALIISFCCLSAVIPDPVGNPPADPAALSKPLRIVFWNLENFFDYFDGGASDSDREFSARGARHWTKKRFLAKCQTIAKSIFWIADKTGGMPDIIALAEVENRFVLKRLLSETALWKYDYEIVHHDSPDRRGIDVALLYRRSSFDLFYEAAVPVRPPPGRSLNTRDILLVQLRRKMQPPGAGAQLLSILVNHHPSKFGGGDTDWRRAAALETLASLKDSLWRAGERQIVAVGDFNDTPDNPLLARYTEENAPDSAAVPPFVNLALPLARRGEGTIRYQGRWELIDLALTLVAAPDTPIATAAASDALASLAAPSPSIRDSRPARPDIRPRMTILRIPFLLVRDNSHPGEKPLRTYVGPRYTGGVSDHLPILVELESLGAKSEDSGCQK